MSDPQIPQVPAEELVNEAQASLGISVEDLVPVEIHDDGILSGTISIATPESIDPAIPAESDDVIAGFDSALELGTPVEYVTDLTEPQPFDSLGLTVEPLLGGTGHSTQAGSVSMHTEHGIRVAQAHEDGSLRLHHIIESAEDDHGFPFDLELGENTRAIHTSDGGIDVVETVEDEDGSTDLLVGRLEAPWAVDSEGIQVPSHYEVRGTQIFQVVEPPASAAYPIVADPFWIPAIVIGLRVGSVLLKVGSKTVRYAKAPASHVVNALKNFSTINFRAGSHTFKLDKSGIKHVLERHHPKYWNGTTKSKQTFFNANMSVNDVRSLIHSAMKQQASTLRSKGTNANFTVSGTTQGVKYTMSINKGRVVQFYPR